MQDLDVETRDRIDAMFFEARALLDHGEKSQALLLAAQAWDSLLEPRFDWDVSQSYVHMLAKLRRDAGDFEGALEIMRALFESGTVEPYQDRPHFVLDTVYYEMGDLDQARLHFVEANRISRGRCFQGEPAKHKQLIQ
ncbi:tetratricopeptide repeat family protein [Lampropedia cohaerens]|uniref:Tetratricopeptide repeat family protein n=1 Tax=Lampropedia cohaerens TaxID=1610491 RepID=A0A0U1Q3Q2_9BURK|nr:hypothetical protein [Lampropedia cohaerens]KKW69265.1 tetratricopeptide repeat family protein [Lampropedia cohaerens]